MRIKTIIFTTVAAMALAACGGADKPAATTPAGGDGPATAVEADTRSLYERLGGLPAITAVVKDFVGNVAADDRINAAFINANIPNLESKLVDQICQATGGPCTYTGGDMKTVHTGMKITEEAFNAMVEDLVVSLDKFKVGEREQNELLGALGSMKPDIVGL